MRIFLVGLVFLMAAGSTRAQTQEAGPREGLGDGAILYGGDFAFMVGAPEDWVIDSRIGRQIGVLAVMYPRDPGWADAAAVIYVAHFEKGDTLTFAQAVALDFEQLRAESPGIVIERAGSIPTNTPTTVEVYHTAHDRHGNYDAVTFIDQANVVVTVVLTARTAEAFAATRPTYENVVASYSYMARVPETPRP